MEVICRGRRQGKTIELIKQSAESGSYIVCMNKSECERIFDLSQQLNLNIPFPISFEDFREHRYYGSGIKGFLMDNADRFLQSLTNVPVEYISINLE